MLSDREEGLRDSQWETRLGRGRVLGRLGYENGTKYYVGVLEPLLLHLE